MQHSSFDSYRRHPIQIAHLAADPLLYLWIDQDRLEQFLLDELGGLDPFAVQIAAQEERFLRRLNGLGPVYYRSE